MDKYINMILLQLSNNYKVNYTELRTYKENRKYTNFIVKLYKYMPLKVYMLRITGCLKDVEM